MLCTYHWRSWTEETKSIHLSVLYTVYNNILYTIFNNMYMYVYVISMHCIQFVEPVRIEC